jgi:hypothetical protein
VSEEEDIGRIAHYSVAGGYSLVEGGNKVAADVVVARCPVLSG